MVLTPLRAYFETLLANTYLFGPRPAIKIKTSEESNDSSFASPRLPWTLAGPQWNNFSVLMQLDDGRPRLWCSLLCGLILRRCLQTPTCSVPGQRLKSRLQRGRMTLVICLAPPPVAR